MNATVHHGCSCGYNIDDTCDIESMTGVGMLTELSVSWTCPNCESTYKQTHPFDTDLMDMSGFHSWVGNVGGSEACIIVEEDTSVGGTTANGGAAKRGYIDE